MRSPRSLGRALLHLSGSTWDENNSCRLHGERMSGRERLRLAGLGGTVRLGSRLEPATPKVSIAPSSRVVQAGLAAPARLVTL